MNKALVELIRKYETKADQLKSVSFAASEYYRNAAAAVLKLAR